MPITWSNPQSVEPRQYVCGFCGKNVGPNVGYNGVEIGPSAQQIPHRMYICSYCNKPTYITYAGQTPGAPYGEDLDHLPADVGKLYKESRASMTAGAFTCATMALRTLLAHIAVERKAKPNESFVFYVTYLVEQHYVPPDARPWVDHIRKAGNEAIHDLRIVGSEEANELLAFLEMILRLVYVYPNRVKAIAPPSGTP